MKTRTAGTFVFLFASCLAIVAASAVDKGALGSAHRIVYGGHDRNPKVAERSYSQHVDKAIMPRGALFLMRIPDNNRKVTIAGGAVGSVPPVLSLASSPVLPPDSTGMSLPIPFTVNQNPRPPPGTWAK